jgi:hypothetical protein
VSAQASDIIESQERSVMSIRESQTRAPWITVDVPELPWRVRIRLDTIDGRIGLVGLLLEPADSTDVVEISDEWLTRVPVAALPGLAVQTLAGGERSGPSEQHGRPWVDAHYEDVAHTWLEAQRSGRSPADDIRRRWRVSRGTAAEWISRARDLGYLDTAASPTGDDAPTRRTPRR